MWRRWARGQGVKIWLREVMISARFRQPREVNPTPPDPMSIFAARSKLTQTVCRLLACFISCQCCPVARTENTKMLLMPRMT
eukprot:5550486-Amphidinium_carterae.1